MTSRLESQRARAQALGTLVDRLHLVLEMEPEDPLLQRHGYRRVRISHPGGTLVIPFDDEYEDATRELSLMVFNLALLECSEFEESEDYDEWLRESGLTDAEVAGPLLYEELRTQAPPLLTLTRGAELASRFDIQMANGYATSMREVHLPRGEDRG